MGKKVLYCNSFEIDHNREVVLMILRFEGPDGCRETVYACISPGGAAAFKELLQNTLADYEKKHGKIATDGWRTGPQNTTTRNNSSPYLS